MYIFVTKKFETYLKIKLSKLFIVETVYFHLWEIINVKKGLYLLIIK